MTKRLPLPLTLLLLAGCVVQPPAGPPAAPSPSASASASASAPASVAPPSPVAPASASPSPSAAPLAEPPMPQAPTFAAIGQTAFAPLTATQADFIATLGQGTARDARAETEGTLREDADAGYEPAWVTAAMRKLPGGVSGNWRPDWAAFYRVPGIAADGADGRSWGATGLAAADLARPSDLASAETAAAPYEADLLRPWAGARTLHRAAATKLAGGGWHLVYLALGGAETLHLVVGAERAIALRVAFGATARPEAGLAIGRAAALAAFKAASADLTSQAEEARSGRDRFLDLPYPSRYLIGPEPGGVAAAGSPEDRADGDDAATGDAGWSAQARRAFGKDHWAVGYSAYSAFANPGSPASFKLLFTSAPGYYGVIRSTGIVDAKTGQVVRLQRRGSYRDPSTTS